MKAPSSEKANALTPEQLQATDPGQSVWVAASAGSGKTHVLSARILRLLLDGVDPQTILCLTYTKAAATEMATRLFNMLSTWIALDNVALTRELDNLGVDGSNRELHRKARQLFATALETPGGLKIQTIHAFCEHLLQLFPVEAGIAPGFHVMEEEEQRRLLQDVLEHALMSEKTEVIAAWDTLAGHGLRNADQLEALAKACLARGTTALALMEDGGAELLQEHIGAKLGLSDQRSKEDLLADISAIDETKYLRWAEEVSAIPDSKSKDKYAAKLRHAVSSKAERRAETIRSIFLTDEGTVRKDKPFKKIVANAGGGHELATEQQRVAILFEALWVLKTVEASVAAVIAISEVKDIVEEAKRAKGLYDFDDLIERTAVLLSSSANAQWVLYKLDKGLNHILVDEAQDTSPLQWRIITALAEEFFAGLGQRDSENRSVFAVGDRKQSVFSFQGADLASFDKTRDWLEEKAESVGGVSKVDLTVSYRSLSNVLSSVDMVFAKGSSARKGFGERGQDEREHEPKRNNHPGIFEFWPLITRNTQVEPEYWKAPVDHIAEDHPRRKLARQLAETVKSWIGKRQLHGENRVVSAGDILILVQKRSAIFAALIAEIRKLDIPVAGADRLELSNHIIVADLLALAQVIILPGDDHALACVLKSPLMPESLDDEALTGLAARRGKSSLRQRLFADPAQTANARAFTDYDKLARQCGPFEFFSRATQQHMKAILTRLGSEAEDAVKAFLDLALRYEAEEGLSLAGFASWMRGSETTIKREMEEAQGQVRIMTVHGSKGLEAPIVILADAADVPNHKDNTKLLWPPPNSGLEGIPIFLPDMEGEPEIIKPWKDYHKEKRFEENMRLLYVGMTRARDELYVCGSFNAKAPSKDAWWKLLEQSITEATGKGFRDHVLQDGTIARRLGPDDVPMRGQKNQGNESVSLPDWLSAPVPSRKPTARKTMSQAGEAVHLAAARRGIVIHALLEQLPDWPAEKRREKALTRGTRHGLEGSLVDRLLALVTQADTAPFFGPGSKAEVDLCGVLSNGETVVGRIDRLARDGETFLVLDYKSGQKPVAPLMQDHPYVSQLAGYAELLRKAYPGHGVKAALLWTQSGELEWIPQHLLLAGHNKVADSVS